MNDRVEGVVKWFSEKKGYGFISRDSGADVFVHYSSIEGEGFRSLMDGDRVEFVLKKDTRGLAAVDVRKV
jgi:CspA family cold shock protein